MTIITIEIPEQQVAVLAAKAQAQGLTLEDWLRKVAEKPEPETKALDWSQCPAVESNPRKLSGAWVFKDTRMPVSLVFENLELGPLSTIIEWHHLTREQIVTVA